eukprot:3912822-Pyramimonas_sp.AAC.1
MSHRSRLRFRIRFTSEPCRIDKGAVHDSHRSRVRLTQEQHAIHIGSVDGPHRRLRFTQESCVYD